MFSYLAKSLLRYFLRKYLENIELESIDYGSSSAVAASGGGAASGNSQTDSGGYGVRLSNVKLREGMELMKLPGKRKRTVPRKEKAEKTSSKESSDTVHDSTPVTKNGKKLEEGGAECAVMQRDVRDLSADNIVGASVVDVNGDLPLHQMQHRERLLTAESETGYFSSSPSTPNQSRSGLCGVPQTLCLNAKGRRDADLQQAASPGETYQLQPRDAIDINGKGDLRAQDIAVENGKAHLTDQSNKDNESPSKSMDVSDDAGIEGTSDEASVFDEEEEVIEEDMALVVGAGGMIGTLNIRLVGKELHVTVEDAHLIVEVVDAGQKKPQNDDGTKTPPKPNLDRSSSSSEADLPNPTDAADEGGATIGERIKKKSTLARYLSMIPHLFLRDCRISLILPPEEGDDESDSCDDCTVFEVGIEFLSVTSGDDILDVLRFDTGNQRTPILRRTKSVGSEKPSSSSERLRQLGVKPTQSKSNNIFQRKRIRTGKGPDGGIWLRIKPPDRKLTPRPHFERHRSGPKWARQQFVDISGTYFFRCSGLDLHAQMLVDIKEDEEDIIGKAWSNEFEDFTMDSTLFGVDWIDPNTLARHQLREKMRRENVVKPDESAVECDADSNGIQSIPSASNFHWIARQKHREDCNTSHLPLNDCYFCWNECVRQKQSSTDRMPLPGFVFSLSMTDPLEVNVDRSSLEALGYLKSLLTSEEPKSDEKEGAAQQDGATRAEQQPGEVNKAPSHAASSWVFDDKSFPAHMQPDAIYLSGVHVSQVIVHVEAIQPKVVADPKFRFWQFLGNSIHYEESQVDSDEQFIRDATFNVGGVELKEYFGVCHKDLLVAGLDTDVSVERGEIQLPFAASRVLGVFSPTAIDQESRTSNACHVRMIQSNGPGLSDESPNIRYADFQLGMIDVDIDAALSGDMSKAASEASAIFASKQVKAQKRKVATSEDTGPTPKWLLQMSTLGGTLSYRPRIKMQIPRCESIKMRKDVEGLSLETFMQTLGIEYGPYSFEHPRPPSITPLCSLPESLRMHVLLYLGADDLTALERVFGIKKKKKATVFLRANALNHHISKLKPTLSRKGVLQSHSEGSRRNHVLSRLQSLDTDSLEALLLIHDRSKIK